MSSGQPQEAKPAKKSKKVTGVVAAEQSTALTKESMIRMLMQTATPTPTPSPLSSPSSKKTMGPPTSLPKWSSTATVPPLNLGQSGVMSPKFTVQAPQHSANFLRPEFFVEDQPLPFIHLISESERDTGMVQLDHAYSKPWNWISEIPTLSKPTKTLFVGRFLRSNRQGANVNVLKEIIDIESISPPQSPPYDVEKATKVMEECENFSDFANPLVDAIDSDSDWEESINKEGWLPRQTRLFSKVCKILHEDQLARIVHSEPIRRRLAVDSTAKRLRHAFSNSNWDIKTIQWLHIILTENLPRPYLSGYIDAMQKLRRKVPSLVDKILNVKQPVDHLSCTAFDGMKLLMKRPWNPAYNSLNSHKLKRLPGHPIIVLTPSGPSDAWSMTSIRLRHWRSMLSNLGRLLVVSMPSVEKSPGGTTWSLPTRHSSASGTCLSPPMSPKSETDDPNGSYNLLSLQQDGTKVGAYLQKMILSIYTKVKELRQANPDRPVILVGWGAAAAINCHVASMDSNVGSGMNGSSGGIVTACICLGFPMHTLDGCRGDPDDPILDMRTPVLFVIGENARQCRSDDVEDMRRRMKVTNSLVVVGGADDVLRLSSMKKRLEGVTQTMVDRCVLDEVRDFLFSVITSPPPLPVPPVIGSISALTPSSKDNGDGVTKKPSTSRPRKRATEPSERKSKKRKKMDETSGESATSSANTTPGVVTKPPPKRRRRQTSEGDLSKARKMLELNSLPSNQPPGGTPLPTSITANSPLLSTALTSKSTLSVQSRRFGVPGFAGIQQPVPGVLGIRSPNSPKAAVSVATHPPRPSPIIQGGKIFHQPMTLGSQGLNISIPQPLGTPIFPPSAGGISIAGSSQVSATPMSLGLTHQSISQLSPLPVQQAAMTISPQPQNIGTQQNILQFTSLQLSVNQSPGTISLPSSPLPFKPSQVNQLLNNPPPTPLNISQFSPVSVSLTQASASSNTSSTSHPTIGLVQNFQGPPADSETPESSSMIPTSLTPRLSGSLTITPTGSAGIPVLLTPRAQSHNIHGVASTTSSAPVVKIPSPIQNMVTLTNRGNAIQISLVPPQSKSGQPSPSEPSVQSKDPEPTDPSPQVSKETELASDQTPVSGSSGSATKPNSRDNITAVGPGPSSSTSSESSTPSSANSQTELRNVAEILASLSGGFLQDPSANLAKNSENENRRRLPQTAKNSTDSTDNSLDDEQESSQLRRSLTSSKNSPPSQRLIRVLQSSKTSKASDPDNLLSASSVSASTPPTPRSRKQMLTPNLLTIESSNGRPNVEASADQQEVSTSAQSTSSESDLKSKPTTTPTRRSSRK